ncbi:MAG TPA: Ig-like domain-containing protein [Polyangiaceae bacterium]|jgi:hypothetical protein|nr:Ig-like domain-containing protein [Polyangiaceae bacterium]
MGSRDQQPAHGPALHLLATYPADGQGTDTALDAGVACDTPTPDCAVPTDVEIELRFDRFLLPGSRLDGGLRLFTGDPKANAVALSASYDLIERVVVLHPSAPLQPNTLYTAEIAAAKDPSQGFWAFDRAPLEPGPVPLRFSFTTGSGPGTAPAPSAPSSDDCTSIANGPMKVCSSSTCHTNPPVTPSAKAEEWIKEYPPMGLSLTNWGLEHTAKSHVAHETETGNSAVDPALESGARFGVQMNIVDPGFPETSYLMYKLLRKPENYTGDCPPTAFHPPVSDGVCQAPSDAELGQLREWFVLGDPMPKHNSFTDPDGGTPAVISRVDLVAINNWIANLAPCTVP